MMLVIALVVIHTDAFRKNKLYPFFTYPLAEMNKFGCIARKRRHKFMHTAEVLKLGILTPLFYNGLVRDVAKMFENQ